MRYEARIVVYTLIFANRCKRVRSPDGDTDSMFLLRIRDTIDWTSHVKSHGETSGWRSVLDWNKFGQLPVIQFCQISTSLVKEYTSR